MHIFLFYSKMVEKIRILEDLSFFESFYIWVVQDTSSAPNDPVERTNWTFGQKATLELAQ